MGLRDVLQDGLALRREAVNLVQRLADGRRSAKCAWDASDAVRPGAAAVVLLHPEPLDVGAGKLADRALDVPEQVEMVLPRKLAVLGARVLDTQDAVPSVAQSCAAAEGGRR